MGKRSTRFDEGGIDTIVVQSFTTTFSQQQMRKRDIGIIIANWTSWTTLWRD